MSYLSEIEDFSKLEAQKFDDFIEAKNQSVSKAPKFKVGVRGFEPPTT
jgi:hypothetical protein